MSDFWDKFRCWADRASACAIGVVLIGGSLWGMFGPEPKHVAPEQVPVTPEMALYHSVSSISHAAASDFMLDGTCDD